MKIFLTSHIFVDETVKEPNPKQYKIFYQNHPKINHPKIIKRVE